MAGKRRKGEKVKKGGSRKRRRVTPRVDGGAGQLTARVVRDLRWQDGLLEGIGRRGSSHLVLGDKSKWEEGEVCAVWRGDGPGQGWAAVYIEEVDAVGNVTKAVWLRGGRPASTQTRRLMSMGKMRCLRAIRSERVAQEEEEDEEEEEEEAEQEREQEQEQEQEQEREDPEEVVVNEGDEIAAAGMEVDRRYWCVDERVDWGRLEQANARAKQLVLPTSLEEETSEFREEVVKRAGVVCCSSTGPLPVREQYALELVIAAVLTTQCRNGRSVLVFRELVAMASERGSWARLSLEEIERLVRPLGFSKRRSQNVWRATRVSRACARACATSGVDALIRTFAGVGEKCGKSFRLFW